MSLQHIVFKCRIPIESVLSLLLVVILSVYILFLEKASFNLYFLPFQAPPTHQRCLFLCALQPAFYIIVNILP